MPHDSTRLELTQMQPTQLWESTAKAAVLEALHRQQTATYSRWRSQWRDLHAFYDGEHAAQVRDRLKVTHPERSREWEKEESGFRFAPIVRAWIERVSMVFHSPPETYLHTGDGQPLPESDPSVIQWRKDSRQVQLNQTLSQLESWTNLLGQAYVQPSWIGPRNEMRWQVHAPYELASIDQDPILPDEIEGAYLTFEIRQPLDTLGTVPKSLYSTWRKDGDQWMNWITDDRGALMQNPLWSDNISRYQRPGSGHPFVVFRREKPAPGLFFVPPDESLLQLQLATNLKLIDMDWILRYQAHATGVVTGMLIDEAPVFGPSRILEFPDRDGDFKFVSPSPNLAEFRECFKFDLRLAAVCAGMSPTEFEPSVTRNLAAKQLENHMLKAKREKAIPAYLTAMAQLWESHKMVGNYWGNQTGARHVYPDGLQLGITLAPIPEVFDRFQDTQATIQEISNGLTSAVQAVQRREGCTRQEAKRRVKQRMQDTHELQVAMLAQSEQAQPAEPPPAQELRADSASPGNGVRRSPSVQRGE